jgi:hypothetical protein
VATEGSLRRVRVVGPAAVMVLLAGGCAGESATVPSVESSAASAAVAPEVTCRGLFGRASGPSVWTRAHRLMESVPQGTPRHTPGSDRTAPVAADLQRLAQAATPDLTTLLQRMTDAVEAPTPVERTDFDAVSRRVLRVCRPFRP